MKKICIVGMGNMGSAMYGLLKSKNEFEVKGCDRNDDVNNCISMGDIFIIAVKPQDFKKLSDSINVDVNNKLAISIMAGISIEKFKKGLKTNKVIRVMPNLPLKCGGALSGWICSKEVSEKEKSLVKKILNCFGEEIEVDKEEKINAITALSGSGPAYYYFLNRILRMKALEMGFSDEDSHKIVKGTFLGAAKLLEKSGECSDELIQRITSKGGTTEAALNYLTGKKIDKIVGEAVYAAYKRAKELNDN